jgi:L,D-transpeptidase ErfK/SrfK
MPRRSLLILLMLGLFLFTPLTFARQYGQILCKIEGFACYHVKKNQSWESLFADDYERNMEMRINRMNTQIWAGMTIAVPERNEADVMDFSPFPREIPPPGEKLIVIDPGVNAWGAYDSAGILVRWGPGSAGMDWCRDIDQSCKTHPGSFRIFSLGSSDCISHKFPLPRGGAPMPYCMYFNNGQALHGEPHGLPGYNASHGCLRMFVNDAEWLRYDFVEGPDFSNHYRGTRVLVREYSS